MLYPTELRARNPPSLARARPRRGGGAEPTNYGCGSTFETRLPVPPEVTTGALLSTSSRYFTTLRLPDVSIRVVEPTSRMFSLPPTVTGPHRPRSVRRLALPCTETARPSQSIVLTCWLVGTRIGVPTPAAVADVPDAVLAGAAPLFVALTDGPAPPAPIATVLSPEPTVSVGLPGLAVAVVDDVGVVAVALAVPPPLDGVVVDGAVCGFAVGPRRRPASSSRPCCRRLPW